MAYVTYSQIRSHADILAKSDTLVLKEAADRRPKHVFLSHSHVDRGLLVGLVALLDEFEASVYIDVEDQQLPAAPSVQIIC